MIEYSPLPRVGALKYSGWSLLGIVIVVQPTFALIGLILTQVVFWIWTQPANERPATGPFRHLTPSC